MDYELIPDSIYDDLPDDPHDKFVVLAKTAHANVSRLVNDDSSGHFVEEVRLQFVETVRAIAEALGIPGLPAPSEMSNLNSYEEYRLFSTRLAGLLAKSRLQSSNVARPYSVQLGKVNKAKIRQEAEQLRIFIENSDLEVKRKEAVLSHLDRLLKELEKKRLSFAKVATIAAAIATTINQSASAVTTFPEVREVIGTILSKIGEDKEKEDAERERLAPPPAKLPPPESETKWASAKTNSYDDVDDIPF